MSKYRRKTANARERLRMGEINSAYEKLKENIPLPSVGLGRQKCEKLTKINLLHIAINYIRTLEDILETGEEEMDICPEKLILNPFQEHEEELEENEEDDEEEEEVSSSSYSPAPSLISSLKREDSSSPDSGIQEDSDSDFPDWTELSSTLDLRQGGDGRGGQEDKAECGYGERKVIPRIVTALPKTPHFPSDAFRIHFSSEKVTKSKPVTLTSRQSVPNQVPRPLYKSESQSQSLLKTQSKLQSLLKSQLVVKQSQSLIPSQSMSKTVPQSQPISHTQPSISSVCSQPPTQTPCIFQSQSLLEPHSKPQSETSCNSQPQSLSQSNNSISSQPQPESLCQPLSLPVCQPPTHLFSSPPPLLLQCKTAMFCTSSKDENEQKEQKEHDEEIEEEQDLFSDICNSTFDSTLVGFGGIDFAYDDPFKVF